MKKITLFLSLMILILFSISCKQNNTIPIANGEDLERDFWYDIMNCNIDNFHKKIADGFLSVHVDGVRDRGKEIDLLTNLNLGNFKLSDFITTQNGPLVNVIYTISVEEHINNRKMSSKKAMRSSSWLYNEEKGWQWFAHANLSSFADEEIKISKDMAEYVAEITAESFTNAALYMKDKAVFDDFIRSTLDDIRFMKDSTGYLVVYDTLGINIAHPIKKDLVGTNQIDLEDCKGLKVSQVLIEKAKNGGGFVKYHWDNPVNGTEEEKIGFVKIIDNTPYVICTGVYPKTMTK